MGCGLILLISYGCLSHKVKILDFGFAIATPYNNFDGFQTLLLKGILPTIT